MSASRGTVHGGARLIFDSVEGVTNTVERMHETIARAPMPWVQQPAEPTRAHGRIAAAVYSTIRGVNSTLRRGVDLIFDAVPKPVEGPDRSGTEIRSVAAINGVFGDHL